MNPCPPPPTPTFNIWEPLFLLKSPCWRELLRKPTRPGSWEGRGHEKELCLVASGKLASFWCFRKVEPQLAGWPGSGSQ